MMASRRSLPFQVWMMLPLAALVITLTATFLWFVLGRVQQRIELNGLNNFQLLAQHAFGKLDALTLDQLRYLDTLSRLLPLLGNLDSDPATRALAETFLRQAGPNALTVTGADHSMFYLLKNDIEAPPGTGYTKGMLRIQDDGSSLIVASYRAKDHRELSRRDIPIDLRPASTEWHVGAQRTGTYFSAIHPIPGRNSQAMTIAASSGERVVALVTPLELFDAILGQLTISDNGAAVLLDSQQRIIAMRTHGKRWRDLDASATRLMTLGALGDPVLDDAARAAQAIGEDQMRLTDLAGQSFLLAWHTMAKLPGSRYQMLILAPLSDLSSISETARRDVWLIALLSLAILLPLGWLGTGAVAGVLKNLVRESQRIGSLDFAPPERPVRSRIREVQSLGAAHETMRGALATRTQTLERVSRQLERLVGIGIQLAEKRDRQALLEPCSRPRARWRAQNMHCCSCPMTRRCFILRQPWGRFPYSRCRHSTCAPRKRGENRLLYAPRWTASQPPSTNSTATCARSLTTCAATTSSWG